MKNAFYVLFAFVLSVNAAPNWSRCQIGTQVSLKLDHVYKDFDVDYGLAPHRSKKEVPLNAPVGALISNVNVSVIMVSRFFSHNMFSAEEVKLISGAVKQAEWVDVYDTGIIGYPPKGRLVIDDDSNPLSVWIVEIWDDGTRMMAGIRCGENFVQPIHNSQSAKLGAEIDKLIVATYMEKVADIGQLNGAFGRGKND
jgi:hypothetical protein